jgi:hypothetical protein
MRLCRIAVLAAAALGAGCIHPPDDTPERQVQERLVGTWLREYREETTNVRRVLVLEEGGSFREMAAVKPQDGTPVQYLHSGEWLFDGTNLKRRYTLMNGERPAAPVVPFATFEVSFPSNDEFLGVDHVHHREVRYQRVADGTLP